MTLTTVSLALALLLPSPGLGPDAKAGLVAHIVSENEIRLHWLEHDAREVFLQWQEPDGTWIDRAGGPPHVTWYADRSVDPGKTYTYRLRIDDRFSDTITVKLELPENGLVRKEGRFVALELKPEHWEACEDFAAYLRKLDAAYLAYEELVGGRPYGGEKQRIIAVDEYPGGWAVAGQPVKWHATHVIRTMQAINEGDAVFGLMHELGHNFDLDYKWVFDAEHWANFKMVYALEQTGLKVRMRDVWYDYSNPIIIPIGDYYRLIARERGEEYGKPMADWTSHSDPVTHKFLMIQDRMDVGWEPFKKTFREYQALPDESVPQTREGKFSLFVHLLSRHSGEDIAEQFSEWGFPVIRPENYDIAAPGIEFGRVLRTVENVYSGFRVQTEGDRLKAIVSIQEEVEYGLRTHITSQIVYDLDTEYVEFMTWAAPSDRAAMVYEVWVDDEKVWESGVLKRKPAAVPVRVPLRGAKKLTLITREAGEGINWGSSDWIEAQLIGPFSRVFLDDLTPVEKEQSWGRLQTRHDRDHPLTVQRPAFPDPPMTITAAGAHMHPSSEPGVFTAARSGNQSVMVEARYNGWLMRRMFIPGEPGSKAATSSQCPGPASSPIRDELHTSHP